MNGFIHHRITIKKVFGSLLVKAKTIGAQGYWPFCN